MAEHAEHEVAAVAPTADVPNTRGTIAAQPLAARMLALQRSAGNAAVNRLLARQPVTPQYAIDDTPSWVRKDEPIKGWDGPINLPGPLDMQPPAQPIDIPAYDHAAETAKRHKHVVFIMGQETKGGLALALRHYRMNYSWPTTVVLEPGEFEGTRHGVFDWRSKTIRFELEDISIVSHGFIDGSLQFGVDRKDADGNLSPSELKEHVKGGKLPKLQPGVVTEKTKIHIKACLVGNNAEVVELFDEAFGGEGVVIAAKNKVAYGGEGWVNQGVGGWWVWSRERLSDERFGQLLFQKYGQIVELEEQKKYVDGQPVEMTPEEKWMFAAKNHKAEQRKVQVGDNVELLWLNTATKTYRKDRDTDEYDSALYQRSHYGDKVYKPDEL